SGGPWEAVGAPFGRLSQMNAPTSASASRTVSRMAEAAMSSGHDRVRSRNTVWGLPPPTDELSVGGLGAPPSSRAGEDPVWWLPPFPVCRAGPGGVDRRPCPDSC